MGVEEHHASRENGVPFAIRKRLTLEQLFKAVGEETGLPEFHVYVAASGDVNACDPDSGWSLLHLACEHMNISLIQALADGGADLNAQNDHDGWTPLHTAVDIDTDSVWQATQRESDFLTQLTFSTTRLLLALGADPTIADHKGETPRDLAAHGGPEALAQFDVLTRKPLPPR